VINGVADLMDQGEEVAAVVAFAEGASMQPDSPLGKAAVTGLIAKLARWNRQ